ncbi:hypothetical protein SEUCBS139899_006219 [Sporothrix eucalyptigena]|uniref:Ribosome maturation protein SDO1/SBDS N-terminal domain-containing protein n=1 Tax=Sporothrix eucalyptigena TaxID=1812306 RepID=A0ABP0ASK1_9PEZI
MARGETTQTKIHYKGTDEDFIVFVDDPEDYKKWKSDTSIPLSHFVSTFTVFTTQRHGVQGPVNAAPNSTLENEFGTHSEDEVIKVILEKGTMQEVEAPERLGFRNESQGPRGGHY